MPTMTADVDLVMMSKANTDELAAMTQHAIDTAKTGAPSRTVNVVVMEQAYVVHRNANTVPMGSDRFNYNRFANCGAKMGKAPWIMVANNDLTFQDGWLDALLRANYPVVSPLSPSYHRHYNVFGNERGWQVGRHLAGWCFMMARWLWDELGGLDESHEFWCSDNVVMDQLRGYGIQPMLVRDAVVHHMVSATLFRESRQRQGELTWAEVDRYNEEHGTQTLVHDPRYTAWKNRQGIV